MKDQDKNDHYTVQTHFTSESGLTESMENYIEVISQLSESLKVVRVKNIAKVLDVKMPSVSAALSVLAKKGMVNYEKYDYVELTSKGKEIARQLRKRHEVLKKFLIDVLCVDQKMAENDSCRIEHHISKQTIENIVKFIEYISNCPNDQKKCLTGFRDYVKKNH